MPESACKLCHPTLCTRHPADAATGQSPRLSTLEYTEDDWRRLRFYYYRLCEKVDAEIGVLLNGLRDLGLEEETYIIFTSDHGDGHGAHNWNQKTSLYEEVINIPFIISHKGVTGAGSVDDTHLVSLGLDLLPTLCDVGGASVPAGLEGLSLRPLAEGNAPDEWRRELVVETIMDIGTGPGGGGASRAVLTDHYKYSAYPMGRYREQLVDLQTDPGEMVNPRRQRAVQGRARRSSPSPASLVRKDRGRVSEILSVSAVVPFSLKVSLETLRLNCFR